MNLTLTMQFDSIDELQAFLNRNPGARNTPVASIAPEGQSKVASIVPDLVEEIVEDPLDITPDEVAIDAPALRAQMMEQLKTKAEAMDEPSILGAFITGFGVKRFSDLPDDMLAPFKAAFEAEFGA